MTNPFCGNDIPPETYAAFFRFIDGEMRHADISEVSLPEGGTKAILTQIVSLDDETLGTLQWPSQDEDRALDKTDIMYVIGQQRIAAFLTEGHELFAVDNLFVEDKGDDALARDAKRGHALLHRLMNDEAVLEHVQLDEVGLYVWQLTFQLDIPSTEEMIDSFCEDTLSFGSLVDHGIESLSE